MITTEKYIFDKDIFDPSLYRNLCISKVSQLVKSPKLEPYLSRIIHLNVNGQIDRIERIFSSWQAYPPGHKPQLPIIDVVDYIEYDDRNKVKLITTRSIENDSIELERNQYTYENDQLVQVVSTKTENGFNYNNQTTFEYDKANLVKEILKGEIQGKFSILSTIDYKWNLKDQIVQKKRTSISGSENQPKLATTTTSKYTYNLNSQLLEAKIENKIGGEVSETKTLFKYTDPNSNQLDEIELFSTGKLENSIKFTRDENDNIKTQRFRNYNNSETEIEFKCYT